MAKLRYKDIENELPKEYGEIAFNVAGFVRKKGLNRQEFIYIRERIYEEAENLFDNHVPAGESYKKKLEQLSLKLCSKALNKSVFEFISNIGFVVFLLLSIIFPIVYGIGFARTPETGTYSSGFYFIINIGNLFMGYLYLCLGVLISLAIQPIEKVKKLKIIGIVLLVLIAIGIVIYTLGEMFPSFEFRIIFILFEILSIGVSVGCYFLEEYLSKKAYKAKHPGR